MLPLVKTLKAVPVVLRSASEDAEILVFEHPQAGVQLVKGTVEHGESIDQAAIRELAEEAGIRGAVCESDLGAWESGHEGQLWHFREMRVPISLPSSWEHYTQDGGGHVFKFWLFASFSGIQHWPA